VQPRPLLAEGRQPAGRRCNLPEPDVIAQEIAEDLRVALEQIEEILVDLG
jgi:hypothetical protein